MLLDGCQSACPDALCLVVFASSVPFLLALCCGRQIRHQISVYSKTKEKQVCLLTESTHETIRSMSLYTAPLLLMRGSQLPAPPSRLEEPDATPGQSRIIDDATLFTRAARLRDSYGLLTALL